MIKLFENNFTIQKLTRIQQNKVTRIMKDLKITKYWMPNIYIYGWLRRIFFILQIHMGYSYLEIYIHFVNIFSVSRFSWLQPIYKSNKVIRILMQVSQITKDVNFSKNCPFPIDSLDGGHDLRNLFIHLKFILSHLDLLRRFMNSKNSSDFVHGKLAILK